MTETQATVGDCGDFDGPGERGRRLPRRRCRRSRRRRPSDSFPPTGRAPPVTGPTPGQRRGDRPPVTSVGTRGAGASGRAGSDLAAAPAAPGAPGCARLRLRRTLAGSACDSGIRRADVDSAECRAGPAAAAGRPGHASVGRAHRSTARRPAPAGSPTPYDPRARPSRPRPPVVHAGPACSSSGSTRGR